MKAVCRQL